MRVPVKEGPQDVEKLLLPANAESRLPTTGESGDRLHKKGGVPAPASSIRARASARTRRRSSKDTRFPLTYQNERE
jgi:hypothetical protein